MSTQKTKNNIASLFKLAKLKITKSLWNYLFRKSGSIVMTLFIVISIVSGFLIYKYLYSSGWNDTKKHNYLKEASKNDVDFNMKKFEKVIKNIEKRTNNYKKTEPSEVKDIFRF